MRILKQLRTSKKGFSAQDVLPVLFGVMMMIFLLFFNTDLLGKSSDAFKCNPPKFDLVSSECNTKVAFSRMDRLTDEQKEEGYFCCSKKPGVSEELYNQWIAQVGTEDDGFVLRDVTFVVNGEFVNWRGTYAAQKGEEITIQTVKESEEGSYCDLQIFKAEKLGKIIPLEGEERPPTGVPCEQTNFRLPEKTIASADEDYYLIRYSIMKRAGGDPITTAEIYISTVEEVDDPASQPSILVSKKRGISDLNGKISCYLYPHTVNTPTEESLVNSAYFVVGTNTCDATNTKQVTGADIPIQFDSTGLICMYFTHPTIKMKKPYVLNSGVDNCEQVELRHKSQFDAIS